MKYILFRFCTFFFILLSNLFLAILISSSFIEDISHHGISRYIWMLLVYLAVYYSYRLMTRRMVTTNEFMVILKANIVALVAVFFLIAVGKLGEQISRTIVLVFFGLNAFVPMYSYLIKKYTFKMGYFKREVFAICDSNGRDNIQRWFSEGNPFGYEVTQMINVDESDLIGVHHQLEALIKNDKYDSAIIDFDSNNIFELSDLVDHIQKNVHRVIILPKISKMPMLNGELISSIHHKGMAFYVRNNLLSPVDRNLKKVFDFLLACCLVVLFSPFLLLLFVIVSVSTDGNPFFRHERIGKNGRRFWVYKFRTMYMNADNLLDELLASCDECREEWMADFKLRNDPRITPIGRFLRKTSLDELPQLINVLRGEMSLVGPRPIVPEEIEKYGEFFEYFVSVKPGMTGLWQVSGRNDVNYDERVQLDVWYVRNWSIELDLQILLKTVLVVLGKKGSY